MILEGERTASIYEWNPFLSESKGLSSSIYQDIGEHQNMPSELYMVLVHDYSVPQHWHQQLLFQETKRWRGRWRNHNRWRLGHEFTWDAQEIKEQRDTWKIPENKATKRYAGKPYLNFHLTRTVTASLMA